MVERTHLSRVVGHEDELVAVLLGDVRTQQSLTLGVEILLVRDLVTTLLEYPSGLLERDTWEWDRGHHDLDAEELLDLSPVDLLDDGDDILQPLLLERHDLLVGVDPRQFHVDRGELGVVARRERRVCPEDWPDLEDPVEASGDPHLLVELRGLGKVGGPLPEVRQREQLGTRLARRADELGRMDLDELTFGPEPTHRRLHRCLDPHDELVLWTAKAEMALIDLDVECGLRLNRKRCLGQVFDLDGLEPKLDSTKLYLGLGDDRSGDRDGRLGGERTHQLGGEATFR